MVLEKAQTSTRMVEPMEGSSSTSISVKETWIKAVRIPLYLWHINFFSTFWRILWGLGGHIRKNRIQKPFKMGENSGSEWWKKLPEGARELSITLSGITYNIPIWPESKPRCEITPDLVEGVTGKDDAYEFPTRAISSGRKGITSVKYIIPMFIGFYWQEPCRVYFFNIWRAV